jgi:hypothetical protein
MHVFRRLSSDLEPTPIVKAAGDFRERLPAHDGLAE